MKRITCIVAVALLLILALTAAGAAAFRSRVPGSWPERSSVPEKRQEVQDERAKRIQERISLVIARFNNNKDRHIAAYKATKEQVAAIVNALAAQGYDVSKLSQDLKTWDAMIVKFATDFANFINKLTATQQYIPFESQGQFKAALEVARAQLRVVRADDLDIRTFYQTTIRPDVQDLKSQKPATTAPAATVPASTP